MMIKCFLLSQVFKAAHNNIMTCCDVSEDGLGVWIMMINFMS